MEPAGNGDRIALAVPAYNATKYLQRLFESVVAQTVPFDEVLVYDDCSSDNTAEVAAALGARVLRGEQNVGYCAAKNVLLENVTSDWIHFHDADDVLYPEFVARSKYRIARESIDAVLFNYEIVYEEPLLPLYLSDFSGLANDPLRYMLEHTVHHSCGVYFVEFLRRIGGFDTDPRVYHNEERAFHLRVVENGGRLVLEPYLGTRIHFRRGNTWERARAACCVARHGITQRFSEKYPGRYPDLIADLCWRTARDLAPLLEWKLVDACLSLASANGYRIPREASIVLKIGSAISPHWTLRAKEWTVRLLRPGRRVDFPGWRLGGAYQYRHKSIP